MSVKGGARQCLKEQKGEEPEGEEEQIADVGLGGKTVAELPHQGGQGDGSAVGGDVGHRQPHPEHQGGGGKPDVLSPSHCNQSFREAYRLPRTTKANSTATAAQYTRSLRASPWKRVT